MPASALPANPNRRRFIRVLGGASVVAATATLPGCDRMPDEAIAPWRPATAQETDPRRIALSFALLAPNAHNIQPWLVELAEESGIVLYVDQSRLLPQTDPYSRQIVISLGAFVELLDMAARQMGFRLQTEYAPQGTFSDIAVDDRPVARFTLLHDTQIRPDPLFDHVLSRRSTKTPYLDRAPDAATLAALGSVVTLPGQRCASSHDPHTVARLRKLTADAIRLEMEVPRTHRESIELARIGAAEINANRDGIGLHGPMFWWLDRLGLMTQEKAANPGTFAYRGGLRYALGWADSTPAFGWLVSSNGSRQSQLDSGRVYVRLNLQAQALGLAIHPVSQLLQEYPEMQTLQAAFLETVPLQNEEKVQMLFRLGYAEAVPPTPRRPLNAFLTEPA